MEALIASTGLVALAEVGDKTQLLALALAARYGKPVPILLGILAATALNHAVAGAAGAWMMSAAGPELMRWALAASFVAMGMWMLVPDKLEARSPAAGRLGIFAATFAAFFLVEIGDKTQVATVALAARYGALAAVVAGTTAGMLIANAPVVLLGNRFAGRMPVRLVQRAAAGLFIAMGLATLAFPL